MTTKEQKLARIYEVIADKTLSFGCLCIVDSMNPIKYRMSSGDERPKEEIIKIIGHPVMIGDVLDWIEQKNTKPNQLIGGYSVGYINLNLRHLRTNKRKPIEDQTDECIDFIYSLINDEE